MNGKISVKIDGKWFTLGNLKKNQWGNFNIGLKKTDELRKLVQGEGWVNLSVFEDVGKDAPKKKEPQPIDNQDEIPF